MRSALLHLRMPVLSRAAKEIEYSRFDRARVMGYIQRFIESTCLIGQQPFLPYLRDNFPGYIWKCHTCNGRSWHRGTITAIAYSDFSWIFDVNGSCVTAKLEKRDKPLMCCFWNEFVRGYRHGELYIQFGLKKRGVVFVTDDKEIRKWFLSAAITHDSPFT